MKAREQPRRRKLEIDQAEQEDAGRDEQRRRRRKPCRGRPIEGIGIARAECVAIFYLHPAHVRASLPNMRLRNHPVPMSMQNTVTTIITRIALTSE